MEEKYTSKFLGTKGLTSAEANYTANIVKELCERINNDISSMTLFKATLKFEGKEANFQKEYKVDNLDTKCLQEGNLYALSAWLREGIKSKDSLIKLAETDEFDFVLKKTIANNYEIKSLLSEEQVKYNLPIDELAEYLIFEAKAAHIGKKIHPNGQFDKWFKALKNTPIVQLHPDNKDYVITLDQTVQEEDLYKTYFQLQTEYREAEQKVNYYKSKVKTLLGEKNMEINNENKAIREAYQKEIEANQSYNYGVNKEIENKRISLIKEISELKIIIPNSLQETLDFVQKNSKK